jgi:hypothetical protein
MVPELSESRPANWHLPMDATRVANCDQVLLPDIWQAPCPALRR